MECSLYHKSRSMYMYLFAPVCLVEGCVCVWVCQRAVLFCVIVLLNECIAFYFLSSLESDGLSDFSWGYVSFFSDQT